MEAKTSPKILVPIDGSTLALQAIPYAARVGGLDGALTLLRVMPVLDELKGFWGEVIATAAEVEELSDAEAKSDLAAALEHLPEGISVESVVANGDPADQIIQTAIRISADYIVMASHGRGAVGRWTFGSIADRVARGSLVPVIIIRPSLPGGHPLELKRIVVPHDGSDISKRALPVAQKLAGLHGLPVHMVEVINPTRMLYPSVSVGGTVADDTYVEVLEHERSSAEHSMLEAASPLRDAGIAVTTQTQVGAIVPAIEATLHSGDLVIITSHGRGGFRRWLLGSVAERLIRDGQAPVLLVPAIERAPSPYRRAAEPAMRV